jgi:hypothetical protein
VLGQLARWRRTANATGSTAVWIEVDSSANGELRPFLVHTLREISDDNRAARTASTRAAAAAALDMDAGDELLDGLDELVERLPDWCAVRHVALRPAVDQRLLRAICRMPSTCAADFSAFGRDSPAGVAIEELTRKVFRGSSVTNVNFDLVPRLGARVGIEFEFLGSQADDGRWTTLFDELEGAGLLCSRKRTVLADWPTTIAARRAAAPQSIVRDLLVKVDFDENGPGQAKAYLPFTSAAVLKALAQR